jgi:hypothetical protein
MHGIISRTAPQRDTKILGYGTSFPLLGKHRCHTASSLGGSRPDKLVRQKKQKKNTPKLSSILGLKFFSSL